MDCRDCQTRMLDLVYGLLDAPEADAVRAHAAACLPCSTALADAGRMQSLLGRASKLSFPDVQFQPPLAEPVPAAASAKKSWRPWVIAAGLLLAAGGLSVPTVRNYFADTHDMAKVDTSDDGKEKPKDPFKGSTGHSLLENAPKEWRAASDAKAAAAFKLLVIGPAKPDVKAANTYSISATDAAEKPLTGLRITVVVTDAQNAKRSPFKKESFTTPAQLTLPASFWADLPGEGVTMTVYATHPTTGDKVQLAIPLR